MGAKPGRKPSRKASRNDSYSDNSYATKRVAPQRVPAPTNVKFAPRTPKQQELADNIDDFSYGAVIGPAGTGKTTVLVAKTIQMLINNEIDKIIITRPIVEAFESIGFLPGTFEEKTAVYLVPIRDALNKFLGKMLVDSLFEEGKIEVVPFAYMRGRSLEDCVVICDEAQNATFEALKMLVTRIGKNSRVYLNGDMSQIDLRPKSQSGLSDLLAAVEQANMPDFFITEFSMDDCQRHPMVVEMLKAIDNYEKSKSSRLTALPPVPHAKKMNLNENIGLVSDPRLVDIVETPAPKKRAPRVKKATE